jgi:putative component of toxin-antitoxin plasmid stabilization module
MTTKCLCGYEKIGNTIDEDGRYGDADPEKKGFRELRIIGTEYDHWYNTIEPKEITLLVCPACGTVKMEEI